MSRMQPILNGRGQSIGYTVGPEFRRNLHDRHGRLVAYYIKHSDLTFVGTRMVGFGDQMIRFLQVED